MMNTRPALRDAAFRVVAAQTFLDAKLKEFEACCFYGDAQRTFAVEEDCRSAMTALLDAKRAAVEETKRDFR
jgi:hypothetical protein